MFMNRRSQDKRSFQRVRLRPIIVPAFTAVSLLAITSADHLLYADDDARKGWTRKLVTPKRSKECTEALGSVSSKRAAPKRKPNPVKEKRLSDKQEELQAFILREGRVPTKSDDPILAKSYRDFMTTLPEPYDSAIMGGQREFTSRRINLFEPAVREIMIDHWIKIRSDEWFTLLRKVTDKDLAKISKHTIRKFAWFSINGSNVLPLVVAREVGFDTLKALMNDAIAKLEDIPENWRDPVENRGGSSDPSYGELLKETQETLVKARDALSQPLEPRSDIKAKFLTKLQKRYPENFDPNALDIEETTIDYKDLYESYGWPPDEAPPSTTVMKLNYHGQFIGRAFYAIKDDVLRFDVEIGKHFRNLSAYEFLLSEVIQRTNGPQSLPTFMPKDSDNVDIFIISFGSKDEFERLFSEQKLSVMTQQDRIKLRSQILDAVANMPSTKVRNILGYGVLSKIIVTPDPKGSGNVVLGLDFQKGEADVSKVRIVIGSYPEEFVGHVGRGKSSMHMTPVTYPEPGYSVAYEISKDGALVILGAKERTPSLGLGAYSEMAIPRTGRADFAGEILEAPLDSKPEFEKWSYLAGLERLAREGREIDKDIAKDFFRKEFGEKWAEMATNDFILRHARAAYWLAKNELASIIRGKGGTVMWFASTVEDSISQDPSYYP